jgi:hypothetical protein
MTDAQSLQNVKLDKAAMEILEEPLVKVSTEREQGGNGGWRSFLQVRHPATDPVRAYEEEP